MHTTASTAASFAILIAAVGGAFYYASANLIEIVNPPWFGFRGSPLTAELAEAAGIEGQQGFLVMDVENGSPADIAGIRGGNTYTEVSTPDGILPACLGGDLITAINGAPVTGIAEIRDFIERSIPGDTVTLTVFRDGDSRQVTVTLAEDPGRPEPPPLSQVCN
jgi:S1-C subfamily serine protease